MAAGSIATGRAVAIGTARPAAMRLQRPAPRLRPSPFGPAGVLALKLVASVLAGATITVLLWSVDWKSLVAPLSRLAVITSPEATESAVDRGALAGWEEADRSAATEFPRPVKTVTFTAPVRQPTSVAPQGAALPFPSLVKSWRYQLQNVNPSEIANSSADLVVIDSSSNDAPFTKAQVERMKVKPDGSRRVVISYMSIGEAENYRWYWSQRSSSWLGPENPKWRGNYGVRFWDHAWQEIIFTYTDRILAAGFDGVYLDKVDEFESMGHRDEMVEFVARIAARAKAAGPDFLIISQNGDQLISDAKFRRAIDGFAREDLFYGEDSEGARNGASSIRESIKRLKMLTAEGKPVFVVEYPRNDEQAKTARREISEQGFIGLTTRRSLNAL
jgi:cysteinyl-tRNA synthetase, unknown class